MSLPYENATSGQKALDSVHRRLSIREIHLMFDVYYAATQGRIKKTFTEWLDQNWQLLSHDAPSGWTDVMEEPPVLGKPVLLCINGVVQHETFHLCNDDDQYWWGRDDCDSLFIDHGQLWQPLPSAPENNDDH